MQLVERADINEALTFEIPGKVVARTEPISPNRHAVFEALPWIIGRHDSEQQAPRRSKCPVEDSSKSENH
jgi:hypothetical protein